VIVQVGVARPGVNVDKRTYLEAGTLEPLGDAADPAKEVDYGRTRLCRRGAVTLPAALRLLGLRVGIHLAQP